MKKVRIISLIMALAMVVTVLSGCNVTIGGKASLPATTDADGRFIYTIVRGENSTDTVSDIAKDIRSAIKESLGAKASVVKDSALEAQDGSYEILLGDTNRPESTEAKAALEENRDAVTYDFIIKVINNKICIQADNDNMLSTAAEWFTKTFCESAEAWESLTEDYTFKYQPDIKTLASSVAGVQLGKFTVVKPMFMSYLIGHEVEELIEFYSLNGSEMNYIEEIDPEVTNEILIGDTSREESKAVTVEGDNYVIKVVGTKLVVKGGNDLATYTAVKELVRLVKESKEGEAFAWSDGYVINGKYDAEAEDTYTLNFFDEFEGSVINTSLWGDHNWAANGVAASSLGGSKYSMDPVGNTAYTGTIPQKIIYQSDGTLHLGAIRLENDFVGSNASSFLTMWYKYGVWEVRAKLPARPGCAALWMDSTGEQVLNSRWGDFAKGNKVEIDLLENYGSTTYFGVAIHRWFTNYSADMQSSYLGHVHTMMTDKRYNNETNNVSYNIDKERYDGKDLSEEYHIYTMYWDDDCIKFAVDGKRMLDFEYADQESVSVYSSLSFLILSNGMGSPSYGSTFKVGEHPDYVEFNIDYVRIYQTAAINSQMLKASGQYEPDDPSKSVIVYPEHPISGSY